MRAPLLRQGCGRLPAAGSSLLPSVAAIEACSLMRGLSRQRMIFELAVSWFWLMDDLDSSIRLNHGFVAGHFLHPGLLATDHEMRASSSISSSGMSVETRSGCHMYVMPSLSVGPLTCPGTARIRTDRMSSTSTSRAPSRISGAWACSRAVITSGDADPGIMIHGRSNSGAGARDLVWMQDFQLPP